MLPADKDTFDEVVFRVIPDDNTRYQAGGRGDLDEFRVSRDQRKTTEALPTFWPASRAQGPPAPRSAAHLERRAPFSPTRACGGLWLSWPREETARQLYAPTAPRSCPGPYPPGVSANSPTLRRPGTTPPRARAPGRGGLETGPDGVRRKGGGKATIDVVFRAQARAEINLSEILRSAYEKIGVQLVGRSRSTRPCTRSADRRASSTAYMTGHFFLPPNFDPFPYWDSSQWSPDGQNVGFYSNPEADRLMEAARLELDQAKRIELYRQIHRLLAADQPADFLWGADQYWASRNASTTSRSRPSASSTSTRARSAGARPAAAH